MNLKSKKVFLQQKIYWMNIFKEFILLYWIYFYDNYDNESKHKIII